jgi:hypothetical protein
VTASLPKLPVMRDGNLTSKLGESEIGIKTVPLAMPWKSQRFANGKQSLNKVHEISEVLRNPGEYICEAVPNAKLRPPWIPSHHQNESADCTPL